MKHERASTSRSIMQTHRLAIELNSSADLSKSTPDGDEDFFLLHGPSSRRPIRVTVEGRLAAATISMGGRQGLPPSRPSSSSCAGWRPPRKADRRRLRTSPPRPYRIPLPAKRATLPKTCQGIHRWNVYWLPQLALA